jgi:CHRD domain
MKEAKMDRGISRRAAIFLTGLACAAWAVPASAAPASFTVPLSGAQQVPPVQTSGTGSATITYDPSTQKVTWSITYSGLSSAVTMAHFHNAAAGKNGPVVLWLSNRGGSVSSPITGAATLTAAQAQQFLAGDWYVNVHSQDHPGGEIRGQVMPPKS